MRELSPVRPVAHATTCPRQLTSNTGSNQPLTNTSCQRKQRQSTRTNSCCPPYCAFMILPRLYCCLAFQKPCPTKDNIPGGWENNKIIVASEAQPVNQPHLARIILRFSSSLCKVSAKYIVAGKSAPPQPSCSAFLSLAS